MGKPADPNTPYCGINTSAALSVGSTLFTTTNPPIFYTRSDKTITVSDKDGIIGTADLSGALIEEYSVPASPDVEYCNGDPLVSLTWDQGQVSTTNPWIKYSIGIGVDQIQVDWGGGDVVTLPGSSWTITTYQQEMTVATGLYVVNLAGYPQIINPEKWAESGLSNAVGTYTIPSGFRLKLFFVFSNFATADPGEQMRISRMHFYGSFFGLGNKIPAADASFTEGHLYFLTAMTRVTSNLGGFTERATTTTPSVTLIAPMFCLTVTDTTGIIFSQDYPVEPTKFHITCYEYDLREISYACRGECPSGTAFQCLCSENNVRMCYGFDPANPDVFRPLFTTTITP